MIDVMIADLREEEQEDIKARDVCELNENRLQSQEDDLDHKIKKKGGEKERLEGAKGEVQGKIETIEGEIAGTEEMMKEMLDARNADEAEFKKALKDDVDAINLLQAAIESITKFYTDNKLPLVLVQEPEYTVDPDKAPDASFGDGTKRKSETTGIIAILSMLKEDLEKEVKVARAVEAEAQAEYKKQNGEAQKTLDAEKDAENTLNGEQADLEGKIVDTQADIDNHNEDKLNTIDEKDAMKPSCQWVEDHFEPRREKRKAEIQGLQDAKAALAGAEAPAPSFLQRSN